MKKISHLLIFIILSINIFSCTGYYPILDSSSLQFKIVDSSILGDKKIGNQIYSRLRYLSKSTKDNANIKNIYISISAVKNKNSTAKDKAGKILGYKINLSTAIIVKNNTTGELILNEKFITSASYDVQNQYSETLKLENKILNNLINKTYEDLLIKLIKNIS